MSFHAESGRAQPEAKLPHHADPVNARPQGLSNLEMEAGPQPLDALMLQRGWTNHDVVNALVGTGLTHKQVAKARRGRRLTLHMQEKILRAINCLAADTPVRREECFNYQGR